MSWGDYLFGKGDGKGGEGFADVIAVDPVGRSANGCAAVKFPTGLAWVEKDGLISDSNRSTAADEVQASRGSWGLNCGWLLEFRLG